jgi:hypothetical protein
MKRQQSVPPELRQPNLCDQYGKIGISAVAAAMLYKGDVKIPEHSPSPAQTVHAEDDEATWSSAA